MSDLPLSTSATASRSKYARYVFWVMFAISFLNYLDRNILTGAANTIAHELGFGVDGIGYVGSAFLLVYTLFTLPLSAWADRAKRKNVVALSVAVWSVITAFTALSGNLASLILFRMLLGVGEAGYFPAGTALLSDYFSREKRSRIMSWWNIATLVGILVGFVLGGELAQIGNWRLGFLITGIPGLLLAYLAWKLREPRRNEADFGDALPAASDTEAKPTQSLTELVAATWTQVKTLLRIKTLVVLIAMQLFVYFVLSAASVYLPTYLQQKDLFHLTSGQAGIFAGGVIVVAGLIGSVGGGYLADWLNHRHQGARVLVCGFGFLLAAPSFAMAVLTHSLTLFALFFIVTTILIMMYNGPSTAATQDVAPAALRASAVGVSLLIAHLLGDVFSPTIVGVLARVFDPTGGTHYANNLAGHDLSLALLITCTPALIIAGLIGIFGARWMQADVAAAQEADRQLAS